MKKPKRKPRVIWVLEYPNGNLSYVFRGPVRHKLPPGKAVKFVEVLK